MSTRGRLLTFHGAYSSRAAAKEKAAKVRGIVKRFTIRGSERFVVVTSGGSDSVRFTAG